MAKYTAHTLAETNSKLRMIQKKTIKILADVRDGAPRTMLGAGQIVQARAQEILTEKGHVVTGNLRRSINTQLGEVSARRVESIVGTWVIYARKIENLPDGGYLFPATEQSVGIVNRYIYENGIRPAYVQWERP